ncbi:hypothetical protein ACFE04_030163 [Oxalis oulophora]
MANAYGWSLGSTIVMMIIVAIILVGPLFMGPVHPPSMYVLLIFPVVLVTAFDHPVDYGAQSHTQRVSFSAYAMVGFVPRTHSVGESAEWNGAGAHTNYRVYKYGNSIVVENIDSTL